MNRTVVATVVFPANEIFINDFFDSLCRQSYKDFDVIVINDGLKNFNLLIKKYNALKIVEVEYSNTPAKIRQKLVEILYKSHYEFIIFGDSDDYLADNRIASSLKGLKDYPIVFNDLISFSGAKVQEKGIWASRFLKNKVISREFLIEGNVLGLGNTAIRKEILKQITIESGLIAVDWAIFYTLLDNKNALFIEDTQTFYRQHDLNTVGISGVSVKTIKKAIEVKKAHYTFINRNDLVNKISLLEFQFSEKEKIEEKLKEQINQNQNYFWWEETRILEN